ncbi:MAG TPA: hypothetical protein VIN33_06615, partial [Marinobacter sp.]
IPNSAVKQTSADGSVASAHVRVGHRQALNTKTPTAEAAGVFYCLKERLILLTFQIYDTAHSDNL